MIDFKFSAKATKILEKAFWSVATLAVVGTCAWHTFIDKDLEVSVAELGKAAPDFTVTTYLEREDGYEANAGYFTLSENFGKVVVVNLWASWCGPCVEEIPHFNELYQEYDGEIVMIAIDADYEDTEAGLQILNESWRGFSLPFGQQTMKVGVNELYNESGSSLPVTFVIDKDGILRERVYKKLSNDELRAMIDPWL